MMALAKKSLEKAGRIILERGDDESIMVTIEGPPVVAVRPYTEAHTEHEPMWGTSTVDVREGMMHVVPVPLWARSEEGHVIVDDAGNPIQATQAVIVTSTEYVETVEPDWSRVYIVTSQEELSGLLDGTWPPDWYAMDWETLRAFAAERGIKARSRDEIEAALEMHAAQARSDEEE